MTIGPEALEAFLGGRHSVRRFRPDPVPEATIRRVLQAATRAPSAHNRQPWRFAVVGQGEAKDRMIQAMAKAFRGDLLADGLPAAEIEDRIRTAQERIAQAPVAIVLCLTMADMNVYPDPRRQAHERTMAIQSLALAGGHILLAAHAEGLGACWMGAPLFAPQAALEALSLPSDWEPQGLIALGIPAEQSKGTDRRPVDEVTLWR
jgi:F420 biosynthesis protein FbiB-like protein